MILWLQQRSEGFRQTALFKCYPQTLQETPQPSMRLETVHAQHRSGLGNSQTILITKLQQEPFLRLKRNFQLVIFLQ